MQNSASAVHVLLIILWFIKGTLNVEALTTLTDYVSEGMEFVPVSISLSL